MKHDPKFGWTQHGLGYWAAGDLRVDTYGKIYKAYRIIDDRNIEHVRNANGRVKQFRSRTAAMVAIENLWIRHNKAELEKA
jgi:hypothetical protein